MRAEPRQGNSRNPLCGRSSDRRPTLDRDSPRRKNGNAVSNTRIRACSPTSSGPRPPLHDPSCNRTPRQYAGRRNYRVQAARVVLLRPKLGALRPQALDRGCGPAAALQQARHRPCQQACPHRLGCSAVWWYFQNANGEQRCAPNRLMLATVLVAVETWPGSAGVRRKRCLPASLDCALRAAPPVTCRPGRRNGHPDRTKELD